jgi:lipoprotein-anchoring transpeptidase ErfK/SrfK
MNVVTRNSAGEIVDYGYRIHSGSVGNGAATHGCLRLSQANSIWLYDQVEVNAPVFVRR